MADLVTAPLPEHEALLQAYVDRRLDAAEQLRFERQLQSDPALRQRLVRLQAQAQLLREVLAPPSGIPAQLDLKRLAQAHARGRQRWRLLASVVLAFTVGGLSGWGLGHRQAGGTGIAALADEALASHDVYAGDPLRPVELDASRRSDLVRWVSARLQRPVAIPELGAAGYRFLGGRLVATAHGPAALLVYADQQSGQRLSILLRPMKVQTDTPMQAQRRGSVAGYAWADRGMGYSLLAPAATPDLHPLADEVRRQSRLL